MASSSPNKTTRRKIMIGVGLAITAVLPMSLSGCPCACSSAPPFRPYLPLSIAIADFNSDGAADMAVGSFRYYADSPRSDKVVSLVLQNRNAPGTFQTGIDTVISVSPSAVATGDLNGNGGTDVVVVGADSREAAILLQSAAAPGPFLPAMTAPTGRPIEDTSRADVAVGDLNGDGALDIAVADARQSGDVAVLMQDPSSGAQFLAPALVALGGRATAVTIGDINGDGRADLVATGSNSGGGHLSIFISDRITPGQFLPRVDTALVGEPRSVKSGDLNGDGRTDIAVANHRQGITVLLQNAAQPGAFLTPVVYATKGYATAIAIGDLDGDGRLDLVVADGPLNGVAVLLQSSAIAGVFTSPVNYGGMFMPDSVALGDLNGDGLLDIAVGDGNRANVLFNMPTTPGSFTAPVQVGS